ncbi:MAG: glycosyltransferase involved in cell wall biosynthesis [Planctomycetota bacterium]|jgi:glycosyltransferase involved in cell wall biosynthesis
MPDPNPASSLRVLALEPWFGGSHKRFLESWAARSVHQVELLGLPPRHWRWRMTAGAWALAERVRRDGLPRPDVLFVSDYVDLPRLYGHLPRDWRSLPALLYFHENQLTYPAAEGLEGAAAQFAEDVTPGMTNLLSCLAAERVLFNSEYHRADFAAAGDALLARLPKPRPRQQVKAVLEAAQVVAPGIDLAELPLGPGAPAGAPLRVGFNHRWEHDKDPVGFLRAAKEAIAAGADLELVLLGERYERTPPEVDALLAGLGSRVLHTGFAEDRAEYARLLGSCDLVASCAQHEFYGMAILEGLAVGAHPLAPHKLSYPHVLPRNLHERGLFTDHADCVARLVRASREPAPLRDPAFREHLSTSIREHDSDATAAALDRACSGYGAALDSSG